MTKQGGKLKALFVAIALAVALTAAPVAYSQTVDTKADIQKATNEWMDAYNKKDGRNGRQNV